MNARPRYSGGGSSRKGGECPPPPDDLSEGAQRVWERYRPRFKLEPNDEPIFVMFCESFSSWRELLNDAYEAGVIVDNYGQQIINPMFGRVDRESAKVQKLVTALKQSSAKRDDGEGEF